MAENKTEEEILETDTVNEEASSAEEETKEAGNEASAGETEAKEAEEKADKKAEKKRKKGEEEKKIRKTNRSKNFRIGSDARWQSLITSVRERKKKKPRCLKSELRVLSKRSFRS